MQPIARKASLIVQELPDETLVYDQQTDKAHCLNATAAFVWKHCDGQTSVHEIARLLKAELRTPADEEIVWLALDRLEKSKLLAEPLERPAHMDLISRREVGRRLGLVGVLAVGLPLVTTIIAPQAAASASGTPCGTTPSGGIPAGGVCAPAGTCTPPASRCLSTQNGANKNCICVP